VKDLWLLFVSGRSVALKLAEKARRKRRVPPGPGSPRTGLSPWGGDPSHLGTGDATMTMHAPANAQALTAPAAPSDPPLVPRPLSFCQVPAHSPNPLIPLIPIEIKNPPNSADYFSEITTVVSASRTTNIGRPAQSSVPRPVFAPNRKQPGIGAACHYLSSIATCCRPKLRVRCQHQSTFREGRAIRWEL
jgi:hypothetical protein